MQTIVLAFSRPRRQASAQWWLVKVAASQSPDRFCLCFLLLYQNSTRFIDQPL
ncbi:MAG: hypothetical protein R3C14_40595 [Caldilineaceae bacterium]